VEGSWQCKNTKFGKDSTNYHIIKI